MLAVKERIAKLLERANRIQTGNEAEAALLLAQKLMARHSIEMSELNFGDEQKQKEVLDQRITAHKRTPWWHASLANIIADNFRCQAYRSRYNGGSQIALIGLKEDVEIATQVFFAAVEMAGSCLKAYCKQNGYKVSHVRNDYMLGFLHGLDAKFKEQVSKEGWGLVLVKDTAVIQAVNQKGLRNNNRSINTRGHKNAYNNGYREGKDFSSGRLAAAGN